MTPFELRSPFEFALLTNCPLANALSRLSSRVGAFSSASPAGLIAIASRALAGDGIQAPPVAAVRALAPLARKSSPHAAFAAIRTAAAKIRRFRNEFMILPLVDLVEYLPTAAISRA